MNAVIERKGIVMNPKNIIWMAEHGAVAPQVVASTLESGVICRRYW